MPHDKHRHPIDAYIERAIERMGAEGWKNLDSDERMFVLFDWLDSRMSMKMNRAPSKKLLTAAVGVGAGVATGVVQATRKLIGG